MRKKIIHNSCDCGEIGKDGTLEHWGSLTRIKSTCTVSIDFYAAACENHLDNYKTGWTILPNFDVE